MKYSNNMVRIRLNNGRKEDIGGIKIDNSYSIERSTEVIGEVIGMADIELRIYGLNIFMYELKSIPIQIGDNVIIQWLEVDKALRHRSYRIGDDILIPYNTIIGILKDDVIKPINGWTIVVPLDGRNEDYSIHDRVRRGIKFGEYQVSEIVAVSDNVSRYVSLNNRQVETFSEPLMLNEKDVVFHEKLWSMPIEVEPYITMSKDYRYIHETDILAAL